MGDATESMIILVKGSRRRLFILSIIQFLYCMYKSNRERNEITSKAPVQVILLITTLINTCEMDPEPGEHPSSPQ